MTPTPPFYETVHLPNGRVCLVGHAAEETFERIPYLTRKKVFNGLLPYGVQRTGMHVTGCRVNGGSVPPSECKERRGDYTRGTLRKRSAS